MATALTVVILILAALAWLIFGGGDDPDTKPSNPDIDRDELAEAESEVRDAPDPDSVRDWGPGVPKDKPH